MLTALFEEKRLVFDAFSRLFVIAYWNISGFLGLQLGYTAVFGSYASFLFVRAGWSLLANKCYRLYDSFSVEFSHW